MEVNILLVIVGGIIAIGAIVGFAKGAVRIAVSLGATILTLAVVYFATPYVSKAIYSLTPIDEMVEQQCIKTMTKAFTGEADTNSGFTSILYSYFTSRTSASPSAFITRYLLIPKTGITSFISYSVVPSNCFTPSLE